MLMERLMRQKGYLVTSVQAFSLPVIGAPRQPAKS